MNAVSDKKVCSRASREARMVNRLVGGIEGMTSQAKLGPKHATSTLTPRSARCAHRERSLPLGRRQRPGISAIAGRALASSIMPSSSDTPSTIPITVFTGFLGAGKTSVILSLLPQLPKGYRVVLLKNEFGDIEGHSARLDVCPVLQADKHVDTCFFQSIVNWQSRAV